MKRAPEADWAMISIWGWTLITVTVILAAALLALIILAIRYLLRRMEREDVEPAPLSSPVRGNPNRWTPNDVRTQPNPSPVPPENPHAPPSQSTSHPARVTRPGY